MHCLPVQLCIKTKYIAESKEKCIRKVGYLGKGGNECLLGKESHSIVTQNFTVCTSVATAQVKGNFFMMITAFSTPVLAQTVAIPHCSAGRTFCSVKALTWQYDISACKYLNVLLPSIKLIASIALNLVKLYQY